MANNQESSESVNEVKRYTNFKKIIKSLYGNVYNAFDTKTESAVIIKLSKRCFSDVKRTRGNIRVHDDVIWECNILRKLSHPNIVKLYDEHLTETYHWMVMEQGCIDLLSYLLKHDKIFYYDEFKPSFLQLIDALEYMHEQHICNMDISLENILLFKNKDSYDIKVCDFGSAMEMDNDNNVFIKYPAPGKNIYSAPEMRLKINSSATIDGTKADIFSLGICVLTVLIGCQPDSEENYKVYDMVYVNQDIHGLINTCLSKSRHYTEESIKHISTVLSLMLELDPVNRITLKSLKSLI